MVVTTSARFWKDCIASEQKQRRYLQMGVSAVFTIEFFVSLTFAFCVIGDVALSLFSRAPTLIIRKGNEKPNVVCVYRVELW